MLDWGGGPTQVQSGDELDRVVKACARDGWVEAGGCLGTDVGLVDVGRVHQWKK